MREKLRDEILDLFADALDLLADRDEMFVDDETWRRCKAETEDLARRQNIAARRLFALCPLPETKEGD